MVEPDPVLIFVRVLNGLGVRYMITGSVASIAYGQPRLTHDVDVVIALGGAQADQLAAAFPMTTFYCPPVEAIRIECQRAQRGHLNVIHHATGFKADLYPVGSDPLHAWALARVHLIQMEGEAVPLAPPAYVILRKLEYYREGGSEKHVLDIRSMLETSGELIDLIELRNQVTRMGLDEVWQRIAVAGADQA